MPAYRASSEAETIELGRRLARELPPRGVVLLIGNLGAGKTTLAKGIAEGLGAATPDDVTSPTFTLIHEYGGGRLYTWTCTGWRTSARWPRSAWKSCSSATPWC